MLTPDPRGRNPLVQMLAETQHEQHPQSHGAFVGQHFAIIYIYIERDTICLH